jgi:DNA primase
MSGFVRERLPDPVSFFDGEGVTLKGNGVWRTGPCQFHGSRATLRVNTATGAWVCMSCGEKGGDVLAFYMARHGLGFVQAAQALGAYQDDGKQHQGAGKAAALPARDALQLAAHEMRIALLVIGDMQRGVLPSDADWARFIDCARRVEMLAKDYV